MGTRPPATVDKRISKDRRHDLGAASPLSATMSFLQGKAGGSASSPTLVELVFEPGSTQRAEKLSPRIACTAVAALSVRSRVLVFACLSTSMARRSCRVPCSRLAECCSILLCSSAYSSIFLNLLSSHLSHRSTNSCYNSTYFLQRGLARPEFFLLGNRDISLGDSFAFLPWHARQ